MKKLFLLIAITLTTTTAIARDFNRDTLDYRNIKDGPVSPKETRDPNYPVFMSVVGMNIIIENKLNKPVEVNGWMFDSSGCDVDLPKDMFRLPAKGRFMAFIGHCPEGSMQWGYLNVGQQKKEFKLINWNTTRSNVSQKKTESGYQIGTASIEKVRSCIKDNSHIKEAKWRKSATETCIHHFQ